MSIFRTEIIEASKARTEFLKWKLIGVSALGAVGLGLTGSTVTAGAYLVLGLIPPVCFYVDLLCRHISLRILVIAKFLRETGTGEQAAYEHFAEEIRTRSLFRFEDTALVYSTLFLSIPVALLGWYTPAPGSLPISGSVPIPGLGSVSATEFVQYWFRISGIGCFMLTIANHIHYFRLTQKLKKLNETNKSLIESVKTIAAIADRRAPGQSMA
jgi:hypothetical protein